MLEVGQVFDSTDHTAQLLTLLFFTMTYGPGLPLLMPLCLFAFVLYFYVDKLLLCRFYQAPPHVGDKAIRILIELLPVAALIRLAVACWMFGNPSILVTTSSPNTKQYESVLQKVRDHGSGFAYANNRIFRPNVFPLFVLLLVVLAILLVMRLWKQLPFYWIPKIIKALRLTFFKSVDIFKDQAEAGYITGWDLVK